ncbi:hypothetical protein BU24DRAFT_407019 [Aaosphaeria arxii CBS 175.79]|uniref:Uncharacterized protein n=1 Tax=Aaosphaeria arxii CBS 175.79 TaxID=1450172 RepID=A0A6A5XVS4_9PLEO|nr:uncharacterized protein BU24DRAFT_407019 [Aaosphaeria arxii CBS 175.79]KAF2016927.1 hypothetical protein BU24DRAFT_407019 [Aaosphaeria arxii CBS 175.79]
MVKCAFEHEYYKDDKYFRFREESFHGGKKTFDPCEEVQRLGDTCQQCKDNLINAANFSHGLHSEVYKYFNEDFQVRADTQCIFRNDNFERRPGEPVERTQPCQNTAKFRDEGGICKNCRDHTHPDVLEKIVTEQLKADRERNGHKPISKNTFDYVKKFEEYLSKDLLKKAQHVFQLRKENFCKDVPDAKSLCPTQDKTYFQQSWRHSLSQARFRNWDNSNDPAPLKTVHADNNTMGVASELGGTWAAAMSCWNSHMSIQSSLIHNLG